ncbi:hypothetical protein B0H17DRAFT_1209575 [Mycena rosella]|uniref:Uncharacterized protein n=1 Tax=Mycena rosella TaxID=1033263 RepID=A0AAD7CY71_MYCRO|nr:hypothetical protein B0H17DRAFT_1209575 [Mycena rosella]
MLLTGNADLPYVGSSSALLDLPPFSMSEFDFLFPSHDLGIGAQLPFRNSAEFSMASGYPIDPPSDFAWPTANFASTSAQCLSSTSHAPEFDYPALDLGTFTPPPAFTEYGRWSSGSSNPSTYADIGATLLPELSAPSSAPHSEPELSILRAPSLLPLSSPPAPSPDAREPFPLIRTRRLDVDTANIVTSPRARVSSKRALDALDSQAKPLLKEKKKTTVCTRLFLRR